MTAEGMCCADFSINIMIYLMAANYIPFAPFTLIEKQSDVKKVWVLGCVTCSLSEKLDNLPTFLGDKPS